MLLDVPSFETRCSLLFRAPPKPPSTGRTRWLLLLPLGLTCCAEPLRNRPPVLRFAEARCSWDAPRQGWFWRLSADATDPNGLGDLVEVWADIYDISSWTWVESFLLDWHDGYLWRSSFFQQDSEYICGDPDYTVRFVVYDVERASSALDVSIVESEW